jgi:heat shock protein HslJ
MNMLPCYGYWVSGDQLILNNTWERLLIAPPAAGELRPDHLLLKRLHMVSRCIHARCPGTHTVPRRWHAGGFTGVIYQGTYTTDVQAITIEDLNSTQEACPEAELDAQQEAMFDILDSALSYQVSESAMQIYSSDRVLTYSLTPLNRPEEINPPQGRINIPAEGFVNQVITFDGSASSGEVTIISYRWDFGDGWMGTGAVVQHVYTNPGTYSVSLVVTDERGENDTEFASINIFATVEPTPAPTPQPTAGPTQPPQPTTTAVPTEPPTVPPQASIQGPGEAFAGAEVIFDASASVAGSSPIVSYAWNFGDGTSAGPTPDSSITTIYNDPGIYQVAVVVTDQNGLSSSATTEVAISANLVLPSEWTLNSIGGVELIPGTTITVQFAGGLLTGFGGCNNYTGGYTAVDNGDGTYSVTVFDLVTTGMACPEEIMVQEALYLAVFQTVQLAQVQESTLVLSYPSGLLPDGTPYLAGDLIYYVTGSAVITP